MQQYICGYCQDPITNPSPAQQIHANAGRTIYHAKPHRCLYLAKRQREKIKRNQEKATQHLPLLPKTITPNFTPFGAHPNSVLSFAL